MKIPQDELECISKQQSSVIIDGSQSARPLNRFDPPPYESPHINKNSQSESSSTTCGSKSCWFNCFILLIIVVALSMELNYRSVELQTVEQKDQEYKIEKAQVIPHQKQNANLPNSEQNGQELKKQEEERKRREEEEKQKHQLTVERSCTEPQKLHKLQFFLYLDKDQMTKQEAQKFNYFNEKYCHFHVLYEVDFDYIIDAWNSREEIVTQKRQLINKTNIKKQHKKQLFIFLQLYFWSGFYVHTSLGLKFGDRLSERFLYKFRIGKQVLFSDADTKNQKGILLPKRDFRALRVQYNFSEKLQKMIRKIISQQDWMDVCSDSQCIIMQNAIKSP